MSNKSPERTKDQRDGWNPSNRKDAKSKVHFVKMSNKSPERTKDQRDGWNPSNRKDGRSKGWMESI